MKRAILEIGAAPETLKLHVQQFRRVFSQPGLVQVYGETVSIVLRNMESASVFRREFETEFPGTVRMSQLSSIIRTNIHREDLVDLLSEYLDSAHDATEQAAMARNTAVDMVREAVR